MIYHDFHDTKLSALGLGCMRLPTTGQDDQIDMDKLKEMVAFALDKGINYFDTAWFYHGGTSENAIGEVLKEFPRNSYYLADKYPGFDVKFFQDPANIFETQLSKCQVDHFDFYLLHNVAEGSIDNFLSEQYGVIPYLLEQKRLGRIGHLGFSTHGNLQTIQRLLDAHPGVFEFCQIQLNWLDWTLQNAHRKVELLNKYNIPVWVMEPVRGGKLCSLAPEHEDMLKALHNDWTMPQWAFRFLQSIPSVTMVLSGMSNMEQLAQNIETFSENATLSA